ncbi:hypothetical protein [Stenotrophomonas sp. VV52]|uniref:hypothetical protein n=1 Tax=Stenotrophomonas sp. VV52 TaxID=2066958 RepID=UPI0015585F94|nr:hypothetical protein [Stenotrophomonas sp. VV52]
MHDKILVLEDDADFAALLSEVLSMAGYNVCWARSTPEAMGCIKDGCVAAAVLDWRVLGDSAEDVADRFSLISSDAAQRAG